MEGENIGCEKAGGKDRNGEGDEKSDIFLPFLSGVWKEERKSQYNGMKMKRTLERERENTKENVNKEEKMSMNGQ